MATWILIPITIFLVALLFFSITFWTVFPDWFGIFGYKRKTPVGKLIIKLLIICLIITVGGLYYAWSSEAGSNARYVVLIPTLFILILWFYRVDKNKRCFNTKQNNIQFFLINLHQRVNSFDRLTKEEGELALSFHCLVPDKSIAQAISVAIQPDCQYVRKYVSGGYLVNKVWFVNGFTSPLSSVNESVIREKLTQFIDVIWDAGGEFSDWSLVTQKRIDDRIELDRANNE